MATAPQITFNLDTVEKDPAEVIEPFVVNIGGRAITMTDPSDLDWQDLEDIQTPSGFLAFAVTAEDRRHIAQQRIPGWKFGKLMEAYMQHYRMEERMADAKRQRRLS